MDPDEVPLAIDELPLVALLGCFAEGETIVRGAQELRVKESDRIAGVVEGLRGLGAEIEATETASSCAARGGLRGGTIDARGDHRMAMMGAVAGLASREGVEVLGMEAAAVSYPRFVEDLTRRFARSDRRPGAGRASRRSRGRSRASSASPTSIAGRCTAASRCSRCGSRDASRPSWRARRGSSWPRGLGAAGRPTRRRARSTATT